MTDIVDAEVVDEVGTELAIKPPASLFGTTDPDEVVDKAAKHATALARVIDERNLHSRIQGRDHVQVEGWQLLGSMTGVFAVVTETKPIVDSQGGSGWEARCEARTMDGQVVGAADAMCTRSESTWKSRDDYAIRSMAQTRATSKALKGPLGFIVKLAGYSSTPAEEIPHDDGPECPKCGSPVWDNRDDPKRGNRPVWKCKDKNCDFASWNRELFDSGGSDSRRESEPQAEVPSEASASPQESEQAAAATPSSAAAPAQLPPWLAALLKAYKPEDVLRVTNAIRAERPKAADRVPLDSIEEVAKARQATQEEIGKRLAETDWSVPNQEALV